MSDTDVYEIDLTKKYIVRLPDDISMMELDRIKVMLNDWACNDDPFLVVNKSVKLVKVGERECE